MMDVLIKMKEEVVVVGVMDVYMDVMIGNVKVELIEFYLKDNYIDLIVIGVFGFNVIGWMIVGLMVVYVVCQVLCDVMVVKIDSENKLISVKWVFYLEL